MEPFISVWDDGRFGRQAEVEGAGHSGGKFAKTAYKIGVRRFAKPKRTFDHQIPEWAGLRSVEHVSAVPSGRRAHGRVVRHGFLASWRPLYSRTGAVKVIGSPFKSLTEAEGACNAMLGTFVEPLLVPARPFQERQKRFR